MQKQCFKCGISKPLEDFYAHPGMADGRLNKCKLCACADERERRLRDPDAARARDRLRHRCPDRQERYLREWRAANPSKRAAHVAVGNAVRDGRLQKQPCAFCGTVERVEAHHHDYSKPLDVTWLCVPCHRRFHALERMATYRQDEAA